MSINEIDLEIKSSAVGSETGWYDFVINGDNSANNYISTCGILTPICASDDVLLDINDMTFLKIDKKGGELGVLKGAELLLKRNPCSIIQVEVTGDSNPIVNLIKDYGTVYGLDDCGDPKEFDGEPKIADDLIAFAQAHPFIVS
jgi:hypothetical protein